MPAGGNFTDQMKMAYKDDLDPEAGADSVERQGDHPASPYFSAVDFYNAQSTDSLTILPRFHDAKRLGMVPAWCPPCWC